MKTAIILALLALLAAGGVVLYLKRPDATAQTAKTASVGSTDSAAPDAHDSGPTATIEVITGAVEVVLPSGQAKTVSNKTTVPALAAVKTKEGSRARILFPDGSVSRLDERSEVKILDLKQNASTIVSLYLVSGRVFSRIKQLLGGSSFEVRTSNTLAAVRGTGFDVTFRGGRTKVLTLENKVEVTALDPKTEEPIPNVPTLVVAEHETVTLDETAPPTEQKPPAIQTVKAEEIQIDPWLIFNIETEIKTDEPLPEVPGLELNVEAPKAKEPPPTPTSPPSPTPKRQTTPTPKPSPAPVELIEPEEILPTPKPSPSPTPLQTKTPTPSPTPAPITLKFSITQVSPETVDTRFADFPFRIFGKGFEPGARAFIGGTQLKSVVVRSATEITALIPKGTPPAAYDVIVQNQDGERAILGGGVFAVAEFQ